MTTANTMDKMELTSRYLKSDGGEKMRIYERIKKYLDDNGIKQNEIAKRSNIPENTFSMILNGKRKLEADEALSILKALGVDANTIFNYE